MIHPTAIVHESARLGAEVRVGAYAIVGADVELGDGSELDAHAIVLGPTRLGARNHVHAFAVLGGAPQRRAEREAGEGTLLVGDDNVFREHVTVHRGGFGETRIGSRCLLMAGAHVAHDVVLGDDIVVSNLVQLAGHVVVEDFVNFGGMSGVAQRIRIGEGAFVAAGSMCERDVPPFTIVQGDRARVRGINQVGLKRRGVEVAVRRAIQREYRRWYVSKEREEMLPEVTEHTLLRKFVEYHRAAWSLANTKDS